MKYDYLIVGSGLFGMISGYLLRKEGKKCLVLEKRSHLGGNIFNETIEGINIHKYGPHIFHTNDEEIWKFVNSLVPFNSYIHSPIANFKDKLYNLPFNMNTFYQLWGEKNPESVIQIIEKQKRTFDVRNPKNLEEQAISLVGPDIYNTLIKGYTEKQWGKKATELPPFIIKRLPVRFTFDNNYFNDKFQGIPIGGYNGIISKLLMDIEVKTNVDYLDNKEYWDNISNRIIYTGKIDEFFGYKFGELEYRSLKFEHKSLDIENFQGVSIVNYTDRDVPFTRIVEHKHFEFGKQKRTVITKEYPENWNKGKEAFYPINDKLNNEKYNKYKILASQQNKVLFGGRLAEYKYYDMHQVIGSAFKKIKELIRMEV